jgi:hypothetical protein
VAPEVPRGVFRRRENAIPARVDAVVREVPAEMKYNLHPITRAVVPDEAETFGQLSRECAHERE